MFSYAPATIIWGMNRLGAEIDWVWSLSFAGCMLANISDRFDAMVASEAGQLICPFSIQNPAAPPAIVTSCQADRTAHQFSDQKAIFDICNHIVNIHLRVSNHQV